MEGFPVPISDSVGFLLHAEIEDSTSPDDYLASDGTQYGERTTDSISGKLLFNPSDNLGN